MPRLYWQPSMNVRARHFSPAKNTKTPLPQCRITNFNAIERSAMWQLVNSPRQMATVTIPVNGTYDFSTTVEPGNETLRLIVGEQVVAEATGSAEPCGG